MRIETLRIAIGPTIADFSNVFARFDIPLLSKGQPKPICIEKQGKSIILLYLVELFSLRVAKGKIIRYNKSVLLIFC